MKAIIKETKKNEWRWRIEDDENERLASGHAPSEDAAKAAVRHYATTKLPKEEDR